MTNYTNQFITLVLQIKNKMQQLGLWSNNAPNADAFLSKEPFFIDKMNACEWLQWVFIPRILALADAKKSLPHSFSLTPYFEEAFKLMEDAKPILPLIKQLDDLVKFK